MILDTTVLLNTEVKATVKRPLNTSKGVIRGNGRVLFEMSESEIVKEMTDQGVQDVARFILKKEGKEIKTNTYFITFSMSVPQRNSESDTIFLGSKEVYSKQNRSTEGCSRLKRSVDMTSSGKNGLNIRTNASPKWDRTRCPEE